MSAVLGVSADYHDAAAAVLVDGVIVAAAEEERFTRHKHEAALPEQAIRWCLDHAGIGGADLDAVAFYDKPMTTYERVLATHAKAGPRGFGDLARAVSVWSRSKLWVAARIESALDRAGVAMPPLTFVEHHQSHAASAFYPSPFDSAAVLTFDGVGEWATSSIGRGRGAELDLLSELHFPDSIGLLYSAFTAYCGFPVNDGEYQLMGLAPYGEPVYADAIREHLVEIASDGSIRIDQRWFDYRSGRSMTRRRLGELLDGPPRHHQDPLGRREADIARSAQVVIEEIVLRIADHARELTGERNVCLAGGVALNCVANARLRRDGPFDDLWVQPAAGDAGGAIGAALWEWHRIRGERRPDPAGRDAMSGAFLGPAFGQDEIVSWLTAEGIEFEEHPDDSTLCDAVAAALDNGETVGWFRGRMEFGPRALGHRSILADPRDATVVGRLNSMIKRRDGFRPFAPACLAEHTAEWFDLQAASPYMVETAAVRSFDPGADDDVDIAVDDFAARLAAVRSDLPACTHVDGSARVQTVDRETNPELWPLLDAFHRRTGCPVLLNTSFNGKDEPIVRSPADAYRCFVATGLDVLVVERCVIRARRSTAGAAS